MMAASSSFTKDNTEECQFFDAHGDALSLVSISDSGTDFSESFDSNAKVDSLVSNRLSYDVWTQSPTSVEERRGNFLSWLGLSPHNSVGVCNDIVEREVDDRITSDSGAVLRILGSEDEFSASRSSFSYLSNDDDFCAINSAGLRKDSGQGCEHHVISEDFVGSQKRIEEENNRTESKHRAKRSWWNRLLSLTYNVERGVGDYVWDGSTQRVKVHQKKKKLKELSALYTGQDIKAHEGSISAMKFSLDGKYLASAGEDGVVRLWQVEEDETSNQMKLPNMDASCLYFKLNHHSELAPFPVDEEKNSKLKNMRRTSDSACVIFPSKVFRLLEKPVHEFHGHGGKILDLTWSKNNYLLSASVDKTVRLWKVGCDTCIKVFSHSDYVTCVQFNPVDEDYFISGSIDGKVRIWDIPSCQVIDWTDIKDMVTAVCYRPDAQVVIVGSMRGNCRFYTSSDNHLQLDTQLCLQSKKKSPSKRITGFQFLPQDSNKLLVTCADSQVRILDGTNVVKKYRGNRNAGNSIYASSTSDGKHIISACEDSNVYMWNYADSKRPRSMRSHERFSTNASIAIPWCGIKSETSECIWKVRVLNENSPNTLPFLYPACFPLSKEFCLEPFPRATATWPEEKLPPSSPLSALSSMRKSQYKFLKSSCQNLSESHAWGLVIITAGWDGRIRSFHNYGLPAPT